MPRFITTTTTFFSWLCAASLGFVGCTDADDDASANDSSSGGDSSTGDAPFAGCERGTLEPDLMGQDAQGNAAPVAWFGPGVDPQTGELIDDGGTYVVSSTYLATQPTAEAQQAFGQAVGPLVPTLLGNPGMVAFQLGTSMQCSSARTLTVWNDEAAMMAFVVSDAHANAAAQIDAISRGGSVVTHWTGAAVAGITWADALTRIAAIDPLY